MVSFKVVITTGEMSIDGHIGLSSSCISVASYSVIEGVTSLTNVEFFCRHHIVWRR